MNRTKLQHQVKHQLTERLKTIVFRRSLVLICALILGSWLFSACTSKKDEPPLLQIGNRVLTAAELRQSLVFNSPDDSAVRASIYIEDWKNNAALYQEAIADHEDTDSITALLIEKARTQIIVERHIEKEIRNADKSGRFNVDSTEVKNYYDKNASQLIFREPMFRVIRLFATSPDSALRFRSLLLSSTISSEELTTKAKALSPKTANLIDVNRELSATLRSARALQLESESAKQLLERMKPRDISPVIKLSDSLYVVFRLEERAERNQAKSFVQAADEIYEKLRLQKQKSFFNYLVSTARTNLEKPQQK